MKDIRNVKRKIIMKKEYFLKGDTVEKKEGVSKTEDATLSIKAIDGRKLQT